MDKTEHAERLRAIARASNLGYYSGGAEPLKAVWKAARADLMESVLKVAARGHVPDDVFDALKRLDDPTRGNPSTGEAK